MGRWISLLLAVVPFVGCSGPRVATATGQEGDGGGTGNVEDDGDLPTTLQRDVDILFVIDNSTTMAEEQRALAAALPVFIETLETHDPAPSYRLAFTTTDNDNAWCGGSKAAGGEFTFSSCRARIDDFGTDPATCLDVCPPQWAEIDALPTTIAGSTEARARPWIESAAGRTNLPAGLSTARAAQCLAPQGIRGCGFESHLEAMHAALERAMNEGDDAHGFLRDNAVLAIVFVTDDADCSYNPAWESIFLDSGNRVFWSLPEAPEATAAVCWNASVACEPRDAEVYDTCTPANKNVDGERVPNEAADADAVLYPVGRYIERLQAIEDAKQALNPGQELVFAAIAGIPTGTPDTPIVYANGPNGGDPSSFQAQFGIGPGCASAHGDAVPPVRLAAVASALQTTKAPRNLFSICDASYEDALRAIAEQIVDQLPARCIRMCVADIDPVEIGIQPGCRVTQSYRDDANRFVETWVPECGPDETVPDGVDVCVTFLSDPDGSTPTRADDLQPRCAEEGWNVGLRLVRRPGFPEPPGARIEIECAPSTNKEIDCPGLPG